MKKLVSMLMVMIIVVSSCGSVPEVTTIDSIDEGAGGDLLVWSFTETAVKLANTFTEWYLEEYGVEPNIDVVVIPYDEYMSKLLPALKNGTGPDIMAMEIGHLSTFLAKGSDYAQDLSVAPFNALDNAKNEIPYTLEMPTTEDGKLIGVTWQANPLVIFYRMDIAEEVGLTQEEVNADLASVEGTLELCEQLKQGGYYCLSSIDDLQFYFDYYKTNPEGEDGKLSQGYLDAVNEFMIKGKEIYDKGYISPYEYESSDYIAQIHESDPKEAKLFSLYKAPWVLNRYLMDGEIEGEGTWGNWRVTTPPTPGFGGGTWLVMNSTSQHKSLGWEFLDYVYESEDFGERYAKNLDYYSDYNRQEQTHDMQTATFLGGDNIYDTVGDTMNDIDISGYSSQYDHNCDAIVMDKFQEVIAGNVAPEDAVDQVESDIYTAMPELK